MDSAIRARMNASDGSSGSELQRRISSSPAMKRSFGSKVSMSPALNQVPEISAR
jgi:hypothetical protein